VAHDPLCNRSSLSLGASDVTALRLPPVLAAAAVTHHLPIPADTSRCAVTVTSCYQLLPSPCNHLTPAAALNHAKITTSNERCSHTSECVCGGGG
jgi:hypothetical protein